MLGANKTTSVLMVLLLLLMMMIMNINLCWSTTTDHSGTHFTHDLSYTGAYTLEHLISMIFINPKWPILCRVER